MDLTKLNEKQLEAVKQTEGPLLVVAGAGSGKTRVLTYKIAYLIDELGIHPSSILAITFTNKAANEMKNRVRELVGDLSRNMWVSTFHSACVRILRSNIDKLGYTRDFVIYDTADQKTVVKDIMKTLSMMDDYEPKYMINQISRAKDQLMTPDQYREKNHASLDQKKVWEVYDRYQRRLKANNALDFDDLINKTIDLFRKESDILEKYQERFQYMMVDEYQDTNKAQYQLIKMLAKKNGNLCVVGDADQSIYKFRGADIRNILDFEKDYPNAKTIKLEQNYRSTKRILKAANEVIKGNLSRKKKNLWTENEEGERIRYHKAYNEYKEAEYIVKTIEDLRYRESLANRDFAILYRMNAQSRVIEESLMRSGITYKVVGGRKFYDRMEIKDLMAYMKLAQNQKDDVSLFRVINVPKRGIGARTVEKIRQAAAETNTDVFNILLNVESLGLSAKASKGLRSFVDFIVSLIDKKNECSVSKILSAIIEGTGYVEELVLKDTVEAMTRIENIEELVSSIEEFESKTPDVTLEMYLQGISLMSDLDNYVEEEDQVVLMTLHSAKGLEFPCVFMVGMEDGIFPGFRSLTDNKELEEERRLCYVGITRAQKHLYMSHASRRTQHGKNMSNPMSCFLEEIPKELIKGRIEDELENKRKSGSFDTMVNLGREILEPAKVDEFISGELKPGTKVRHKVFGEGMVISSKGSGDKTLLTIAFDQKGVKKLMLGFAPLEIIG
ncbi:MAG: DNA helicase PcrA [Peptostreptococcaceae bacterium]|nr:DNA helicase PcrA [Peptostreptococcaceae bacterium]